MTSKERLEIIKQRINTIRLNTKIGSRRIADEENAVLLDHIEYNLNEFYKLVERDTPKYLKQEKLLGLYKKLNEVCKELITLARYNSWSWDLDSEITDIQKQIKELEK